MDGNEENQIQTQATDYFRELEGLLQDLGILSGGVSRGLEDVSRRLSERVGESRLVLYLKRRRGEPHVRQAYWGRRRKLPLSEGGPGLPPSERQGWIRHLRGSLDRDRVAGHACDIAHLALYERAEKERVALSQSSKALVRARLSVEHTLAERSEPRAWEAGDLFLPTPIVSDHLPATSQRALGRAWRFCVRAAALESELRSIARRHNARPAARGLWLVFERDSRHRYGRLVWTLGGVRLLGLGRACAKTPARVTDLASLPDRALRRIPELRVARAAIRPHEMARRRMAALHEKYTRLFGRLRKRVGEAKALAAQVLDRGVRETG